MTKPTWTYERIELLKKLHSEHLSCSAMAVELGGDITRSAVLGKLRRLGLSQAHPPGWGQPKRPKSARSTNWRSPTSRAKREKMAAEFRDQFVAVEIVDLPPDESAVAVPLQKLSKDTCRWPLGDPRDLNAMLFCGDQPYSGYPYCERHARIAYIPLQRRAA